jgi:hypothetical protein
MGDSMYKSTLDCFAKTLKNDVWNPFLVFFFSISCVYWSILLQLFFHLFKSKKSFHLVFVVKLICVCVQYVNIHLPCTLVTLNINISC